MVAEAANNTAPLTKQINLGRRVQVSVHHQDMICTTASIRHLVHDPRPAMALMVQLMETGLERHRAQDPPHLETEALEAAEPIGVGAVPTLPAQSLG